MQASRDKGAAPAQLQAIVAALRRPEAYPEPPEAVEVIETHISYLFLTGRHVYKVKKPVDFGFLDFTTLEKRRHFCHQEVALNRRLSPDLYLGVVEVVRSGTGYAVEALGEAVEYAVKMRQLPRERMMDALLPRGRVREVEVHRVAEKIARFHQEAETSPEITRLGGLEAVRYNLAENFQQTERYVGTLLSPEAFDDIRAYSWAFLAAREPLLREREAAGRVRDCHGDLHTAQICLENGIAIIDCIEFNDRFRYSDVANDVAFLAMDLDFSGRADLGTAFIQRYADLSGDTQLPALLDLFKAYRAYVRGKVTAFQLDEPALSPALCREIEERTRRYFDLCHSYASAARPQGLVLTAGLMGTGKSFIAQELSRRWGLHHISSDVVRKSLAGIPATEHRYVPFDQGIYAPEMSRRTYDEMFRQARQLLKRGGSVILDATFSRAGDREAALALARTAGAPVWLVHCHAEETVLRSRLDQRMAEVTSADGRWEIYHQQRASFEPIGEMPEGRLLELDTSGRKEETVRLLLEGMYRLALAGNPAST